jgi:S-adenosylmethionine uptake transporter
MSIGMAFFVVNDTLLKIVLGQMPLFQALFLRGLLTSFLLALIARAMGGFTLRLPRQDLGLIALRTISEVAAAYFFLTALIHMPLANATAILQALPLLVTLGAALLFGERIGWRRMTAIAVGFAGVLLIVQPGAEGFTRYSIYALISVLTVAVRDLATRRMSRETPSLTVAVIGAVGVTAFSGAASLADVWTAPPPGIWAALLGASLAIVGGYICSVSSMRVGEMAVVTPFRYSGLLWSLAIGLGVFGDFPDPLTLVGAAIVVATGLFTFHRERLLSRRRVTAAGS